MLTGSLLWKIFDLQCWLPAVLTNYSCYLLNNISFLQASYEDNLKQPVKVRIELIGQVCIKAPKKLCEGDLSELCLRPKLICSDFHSLVQHESDLFYIICLEN